ncbi:hypothetical protein H4R18_005926 [Coemansia javaensis]|uniref:Uncharacterized protein n=1 Tax=Coemansia javaensis TaxID=2761396 RepID=A0A9W8LEW0_9FUNG|nr:hypothetical protein H4R18_005926 [Coemansia javaensis]
MGVYARAFFVIVGGLLGGSVGLYYQAKEERRLAELRQVKLDEMRRLSQDALPAPAAKAGSEQPAKPQ